MKHRWKICIVICSLFVLTGCWDKKELSEIKVVAGMAIDIGEDAKFKVTVEALNAAELNTQTSGGNAPSLVESLEGNTLSDVVHQFNQYYSDTLIFSHMKLLVIGEEIATKGITEFLDYIERDRELRDDFNIIIARGNKAGDILKVTNQFRKSSSLKIAPQLDNLLAEWGGDTDTRINDFISDLSLEGKESVLSAVRIKGDIEKGASIENLNKVVPDAMVVVDSLAVFKGDKVVGFLPIEDTRNYLWVRNALKQTTFEVTCHQKDNSAVRIIQTTTDVKTKWENGKPAIKVKINAEGFLEGTQCYPDVDKIDTFVKYEKLVNKQASKQILESIQIMQQEYQSDIYGFGEAMRRQDYHEFMKIKDNWDEEFSKAKVEVDFDLTLRRAGIRTKSFLTDIQ